MVKAMTDHTIEHHSSLRPTVPPRPRRRRLLNVTPADPWWWIWIITTVCLVAGAMGTPAGYQLAILISAVQTAVQWIQQRSLKAPGVQVRFTYTICLLSYALLGMPWLFWIPAAGTAALLLVGYCLLARSLSLMPWNRSTPLSVPIIFRTFFSSPVVTRSLRPPAIPGGDCPGGVCILEFHAATRELDSATSTASFK